VAELVRRGHTVIYHASPAFAAKIEATGATVRLYAGDDTRGLPLTDLMNAHEPLNLVFTSRSFQPGADTFDSSYRFVGASVGARLPDPAFAAERLTGPVLYASLGTVFDAGPALLRTFATALAPLGGTVVVATGHTDPGALGELPANVLALQATSGAPPTW
jgi:MGT family glycosyltransferase